MATGSKRGGDMVLGGRHLAGMFVVLVVLFGVVFTLGYVMGRNQTETQLSAPSAGVAPAVDPPLEVPVNANRDRPTAAGAGPANNAAPDSTDWDFYRSAEPSSPSGRLVPPQPKPVSTAKAPATAAPAVPAARRPPARPQAPAQNSRSGASAPLIAKDATVLQVAALVRQDDALALAQALQQKKFPAFVLNPAADHFYRVQVGPYADLQSANIARKRLETQGFKSIVKR